MEYTNPQMPEGINASQEHPLKEFFWLSASLMTGLLVLVAVAVVLADTMVTRIPFHIERDLAARYISTTPASPELDEYLNSLAARITRAQGMPEEMSVRIHYVNGDTINAFATLGGHIFIFRGLLEKLPNENALAMLLAHEIAHIKHRDPIRGLGRGVVIGMSLSMLSREAGSALLDRMLSQGSFLTLMKYSRDQERAADRVALATVHTLYGHARGADTLFEVLLKTHGPDSGIELFRSHPRIMERIDKVRAAAAEAPPGTTVTALPEGFAGWLKAEAPDPAEVIKLETERSFPLLPVALGMNR